MHEGLNCELDYFGGSGAIACAELENLTVCGLIGGGVEILQWSQHRVPAHRARKLGYTSALDKAMWVFNPDLVFCIWQKFISVPQGNIY